MTTKNCTKCGEEKVFSEYGKWNRGKDGLRPHCKDCKSVISRKYREENREKIREYRHSTRHLDREHGRIYRARHPDRLRERKRRHYEENKDFHLRDQRARKDEAKQITEALATVRKFDKWTPDEDEILMADDGMTVYQKAIEIGRSHNACTQRRYKLRKELNHVST